MLKGCEWCEVLVGRFFEVGSQLVVKSDEQR